MERKKGTILQGYSNSVLSYLERHQDVMKELTQNLLEGMRKEVGKTMRKIDSCRDMTGDTMKSIIRNGMENLVKAVEGVLLGLSEELDKERKEREVKEEEKDKILEKVEEKIKSEGIIQGL
ncbi:MAG: hypothetical protein ACK559_40780, partial [bacterium]